MVALRGVDATMVGRVESASNRRVLGPGIEERLLPMLGMAGNREAVVDRASLVGTGVAALVETEQEVGEEEIAALPGDGDRLMQGKRRIQQG